MKDKNTEKELRIMLGKEIHNLYYVKDVKCAEDLSVSETDFLYEVGMEVCAFLKDQEFCWSSLDLCKSIMNSDSDTLLDVVNELEQNCEDMFWPIIVHLFNEEQCGDIGLDN